MSLVFVSKTANNCVIQMQTSRCLKEMVMCTDCSCDQTRFKASLCENLVPSFNYYQKLSDDYLDVSFISIGAVANTLLLMTLMQKMFSDSLTFLYIRITAAIGLVQTLWQLVKKILVYCRLDLDRQTASLVLYFGLHPYCSDAIKLLVSTFSVFLSIDRLMCVVVPVFYSFIKNKRFVVMAFLVSFLTCSLSLYDLAVTRFYYDTNVGGYRFITSTIGFPARIFPQLVMTIRLGQMVLMVVLAIVVVVRLKLRFRRTAKMMINESALNELKKTANLCRFQILETAYIVLDLFFLTFYEILLIAPPWVPQNVPHTYAQYLTVYPWLAMFLFATLIRNTAYHFSQFLLFFLYLFFSSMFRQGLFQLLKFLVFGVKSLAGNRSSSGNNSPSKKVLPFVPPQVQ